MGPSKTDGSWWRVLTNRGSLEKEMANHFSILALRTPRTVWWSDSLYFSFQEGGEILRWKVWGGVAAGGAMEESDMYMQLLLVEVFGETYQRYKYGEQQWGFKWTWKPWRGSSAKSVSLVTWFFDNGMSFLFLFLFCKTGRERRKGRKARFSGTERKVTISPGYHYLKTTVITK